MHRLNLGTSLIGIALSLSACGPSGAADPSINTGTILGSNTGSNSSDPCLHTAPFNTLDFGRASAQTTRTVQICNGSPDPSITCSELRIDGLQITQAGNSFSIATQVAAGTRVAAGACTNVDIQFTPTLNGGPQSGSLEIASNDQDFAPPSNFVLNLFSDEPLDQLPIALLEGPGTPPQQNGFPVKLSTLTPKRITVTCQDSTDDHGISFCQFFLARHPPNSSLATMITQVGNPSRDMNGVKTTDQSVDLNVDVPGEYDIALMVYDTANQSAAETSLLRIFVSP